MMTEDRRVRKTKKLLLDALTKLLLEKPLQSITVREISELADINRGTFYLHYKDIYDMVEQIQNDIFEKFDGIVKNSKSHNDTNMLFPMMIEIYTLLSEYADLVRGLLGKNGDAAFIAKLKAKISERCFNDVQKVLDIKNKEDYIYFYNFIESGCIGLFLTWLTGGAHETPAQMASLTERLILSSTRAIN